MVGLSFRRRKKANYEHIAQLERENGLDDGTFSDEWVDDMQSMLDAAGIGAPPKKRTLFKPPLLEKTVYRPIKYTSMSYSSGFYTHVDGGPFDTPESKIVIARG